MKQWICTVLAMIVLLVACKKDNEQVPLVAAIEGDQFEILAGDSISFRDISTGQASRWKWTFEGGTPASSELSSPTVTYTSPGTYKVTLEVSNQNESNSITKDGFVTVGYNQISANFSADKTIIQQGESVQFTDLTTGIPESWQWEFIHETQGALYTSTEQNPLIQFDEPGIYTVKLKASNPEFEGEKTVAEMVEVIDPSFVSAGFAAAAHSTYTGGSITFEDQSLGNVQTRAWTFEGGNPATSSDANPVVSYAVPGRYKVSLTVSNTENSSDKVEEQYILVVPGDQLAAYFPFDGSAVDAGPDAIPVILTGTPAFTGTDRNNKTGFAASFDGASGVAVQSQTILNLGTGDFSVTGWLKASSSSRMMVWQESGKNGSNDNQSWLRMGDNSTDRQLRFNTEAPGGGSILNMGNEGKLNTDQWIHFTCVRSGTKMMVYVNGTKVKEMTTPNIRNVTGNQAFKIAMQEGATSFNNFFTGQLDDFMIYRKALSEVEIQELIAL
ncbi:PKD domain-containing protein [Flavihumibacter sp. UBA7668]|uniref:PKD domain-containing protein n=1 Tax=Flavihumibacter sp. UBA7668 TaxID=1946542 RepID=UPI0025BDB2F5|nr:PKD domain-containing protein [Flavihumibacter sp. UBA7668]